MVIARYSHTDSNGCRVYLGEDIAVDKRERLDELGWTAHKDLGIKGDKYVDKVFIGNDFLIIESDVSEINSDPNPSLARHKYVKKKVKEWISDN